MARPHAPFRLRLLLSALLLAVALPASAADDPAARKILEQVTAKNAAGFQTGQSKTAITLRLASGKEKTWVTLARVARRDGKLRTRVTFLEPADSVGTELLMLEQGKGETSQYLWLPKTKRLRRIGGSSKNEAFMGTDFSYGDLESRGMQTGESKKLGQEAVGGVPCAHIVVQITDADDAYGKAELWIDEKQSIPRQMKLFDKAGVHVKTFLVDEVAQVDGRTTLKKFRMLNHLRNSVTTVETRDIDTKVQLADDLFVPEALGR